MYLDRDGKIQSVAFRMPEDKKKGKAAGSIGGGHESVHDGSVIDAQMSAESVKGSK